MANFPFGANKILRDGFSETPPQRIIRTNMDVGPAKVRRRTFAATYPIKFKMYLTNDEFETLRTFYLANDASIFDFTNPRTNQILKARFTSEPSGDFDQTMWDVGVELEIMP